MGKLAIRETDPLSTGHICAATTTLDTPGQGDVYIEGILVSRKGDPTVSHPFPPAPGCAPHVATVGHGSPTVYCHGAKVGYITGPADAGVMTGANGTVYVATNAEAIALSFNIPSFEPPNLNPDFPSVEAFATEIVEGADVEEAAGNDPDTFEAVEYGDGGIPTDDRYGNVSPINNVEGAQPTPVVETGESDSPNPDASGTPGLNFLPHTDPRIKEELRQILETVAANLGVTLTITSAYRSPEYNESVGGATNSQHVQGNACDVVMTGWSTSDRANFITECYNAGARGFGVYNSFTHVDIGGKRAWGNTGSRTSLPRYPWAQAVLGPLGYATS
jgi:hypothetical protein